MSAEIDDIQNEVPHQKIVDGIHNLFIEYDEVESCMRDIVDNCDFYNEEYISDAVALLVDFQTMRLRLRQFQAVSDRLEK